MFHAWNVYLKKGGWGGDNEFTFSSSPKRKHRLLSVHRTVVPYHEGAYFHGDH